MSFNDNPHRRDSSVDSRPQILSVKQAAELFKVSEKTIRRWVATNRVRWIQPVKHGAIRIYLPGWVR